VDRKKLESIQEHQGFISELEHVSTFSELEHAPTVSQVAGNPGIVQDFIDTKPAGSFLRCVKCRDAACHVCLLKMLCMCSAKTQKVDRWCLEVKQFLRGQPVSNFVGNCCEHREQIKNVRALAKQDEKLLEQLRSLEKEGKKLMDGMLYLPEIRLFLDTPFDCVDIHGFGLLDENSQYHGKKYQGLFHCVCSLSTTVECGQAGAYPKAIDEHPGLKSLCCYDMEDVDYDGSKRDNKVCHGSLTTVALLLAWICQYTHLLHVSLVYAD